MNLENVEQEDWIVGGLALLLAICLLLLPWFNVSLTVGAFTASANYSATSTPDGWIGILAFIVALAIVADLAIERLSPQTQVPAIGGSRTQTRFTLAVIAAALIALKFLFHIHFSGIVSFAWGFYLDVIVVAALVYFAAQARSGSGVLASRRPRSGNPPPPPPPPAEPTSGSTPPPGL